MSDTITVSSSTNSPTPQYTIAQILEYKIQGFSNVKIGKIYGVTETSIRKKLKGIFEKLNIETVKAYQANKVNLLTYTEKELLDVILDQSKLKKATLGNIAYAYDKINNINRLEQGKATQVIENRTLIADLGDLLDRIDKAEGGD